MLGFHETNKEDKKVEEEISKINTLNKNKILPV